MVPSLPLRFVCPLMVRPSTVKFARPRIPRTVLARRWRHVRQNGRVRNLFDQAQAERRRGNPENHIPVRELPSEIRLRDLAGARTVASGDREQGVDAAIRGAIGIPDESHLAHRAVRGQEGRDEVPAAVGRRESHLRIDRGTGAADRRLRMATAATIEIQRRAKSFGNLVRLLEVFLAGQEVFVFVIRDASEQTAGGAVPPRTPDLRARRDRLRRDRLRPK